MLILSRGRVVHRDFETFYRYTHPSIYSRLRLPTSCYFSTFTEIKKVIMYLVTRKIERTRTFDRHLDTYNDKYKYAHVFIRLGFKYVQRW